MVYQGGQPLVTQISNSDHISRCRQVVSARHGRRPVLGLGHMIWNMHDAGQGGHIVPGALLWI